ncbi:MAG: SAM-dependent methyltransferase, partial [Actinomycetota bacterium]|nr:SAM-dependent methyltransferase [Actinomycetota bacterium]
MNSSGPAPASIDTGVPHSARVWNYWLGGKDHFAADREVGDRLAAAQPGIVAIARASRAFLVRAVRHLAGEAGIRQFLDIGTGLPTANNTHEVAQATTSECRIVYVDNDPLVLVHARALLTSTPEGATDYIEADIREPETILQVASRTLNFDQPIALILQGITHHIEDYDEVYAIVHRLLDGLTVGSYLVLGAPSCEGVDGDVQQAAFRLWNESGGRPPVVARSRQEIAQFFD